MWLFRFSWNGPGWQTDWFCFAGGNETPRLPVILSGFVSIPPLKVGAPQGIVLRISPERSLVGAITEISIWSWCRVRIQGHPVRTFAICFFLVPADPTGDPPRKKETETKYPDEFWGKQRAKPLCFVSRNQKRPGRHFYCFLETKQAKNPGLFPMFPFSCVSTSALFPGKFPMYFAVLRWNQALISTEGGQKEI